MDADEFPLGKIMRWFSAVGLGLTFLGVAFVWFFFD
jgi:hypothetical protein